MKSGVRNLRGWANVTLLIAFVVSLVFLGNVNINNAVEDVLESNGERKARSWANFLAETMPDLEHLIATGKPTEEQLALITDVIKVGDVFEFKLFGPDGQLVLNSQGNCVVNHLAENPEDIERAVRVLETGEAVIAINDGTMKENRPDLYVEAYVPVFGSKGKTIGVVEVYLDETPVSNLFRNSFLDLLLAFAMVAFGSFLAPFSAFVAKMRQQLKASEQVRELSSRDQLTGLFNRATFFQEVDKASHAGSLNLARAAVVFVDLDNFKTINDTFGHKSGDAFLRHVGKAISSHMGENDIAARIGGDEFIFVSADRDLDDLALLVESIRETVRQPIQTDGVALSGHLSLGVHFDETADLTLKERMHNADIALYEAKQHGRDTWVIYSPDLEANCARRRHVEECVVSGLDNNFFEIYYQPIIEQPGARTVGFEALLRLKDSNGQSIPPSEFIPIAEEAGEVGRIGRWVLRQAIKTAASWPEPYFVSVNLSSRQFDCGKLPEVVGRLLKQYRLAPYRLELEVAEQTLIEKAHKIGGQLKDLDIIGVTLAMDGFGAGVSSLGYLWNCNFHKLKIHRSYGLALAEKNEKSRQILKSLVSLGHHLGMIVTIEGIETETQVAGLGSLAFDQLQGFHYGLPLPPDKLELGKVELFERVEKVPDVRFEKMPRRLVG